MATYPSGPPNRGMSQRKMPSYDHYDPNFGRASHYSNTWTLDTKIRTGVCRLCNLKFAKCDYNIRCDKLGCNMHICQFCWEGKSVTTAGEKRFEGHYMNETGCLCRTGGVPLPSLQRMLDARTARILAFMAKQDEKREASSEVDEEDEEVGTHVKKFKAFEDDEIDGDLADVAMVEEFHSSPPVPKTPINNITVKPSVDATMSSPLQGSEENFSAQSSSSVKTQTSSNKSAHSNGRNSGQIEDAHKSQTSSNQTVRHLHGKTTVIIGAGIVGLSVARELAIHAAETNTEHTIVVVEARSEATMLTSSSCGGLIATSAVPSELAGLSSLSKECWTELLDTEDVAEICSYNSDGVRHVRSRGTNEDEMRVPDWLKATSSNTVIADDDDVGKISTIAFMRWLYNECYELEVHFYFDAQAHDFKKHGFDGRILSVDLVSAESEEDEEPTTIKCQNLVVAAGPWTSGIVAGLLPWANFSVNNYLKRYEHVRFPWEDLYAANDFGVIFGDGDRNVIISARPDHEDIFVAAVIDKGEHRPLSMDSAVTGNTGHNIKSAQYAAKKYLASYDETGMTKACTWICTATESGLPIIDKIPAAKIDERFGGGKESPLGIWLCYGFGKFGTTLAPGAARALRRRICGEESGVVEAVCAAFE